MPIPPSEPPTEGVTVLYIAGWGRSGTTVLDTILGAHRGIFSGGELHYLWERGFVEGRKCGCGRPLAECALWNQVLHSAFGGSPPEPERMVELQRQLVRVRHTGGLISRRLRDADRELQEYLDVLARLYPAIAEVSGSAVVVDSSKRPSDAAMLAGVPGVRPYLLHLVRDPRAVAFSWRRPKEQLDRPAPATLRRHGVLDSTVSWTTWNVGTEALRRSYPPGHYLRMRYEDFAAAPLESVRRILSMIGVDERDSPFTGDRTIELPGNHTASGNPNRFRTGETTIRTDDAWRRDQRRVDRWVATSVALPLLRRYGYSVSGRPRAARSASGQSAVSVD